MSNFNIGNTVSWQVRNMLDTSRGSSSFHRYHGTVITVTDTEIVARYTWTRNGVDLFEANKTFRKLKNGKWIPRTEKRDDPKGRLYLCLDVNEIEALE